MMPLKASEGSAEAIAPGVGMFPPWKGQSKLLISLSAARLRVARGAVDTRIAV